MEEHGKGASRCQNTERYIIIGASVSEPPLVDSTDALSRYIYIIIIGRAGASPPSRTTGPRCLYISGTVRVPDTVNF